MHAWNFIQIQRPNKDYTITHSLNSEATTSHACIMIIILWL